MKHTLKALLIFALALAISSCKKDKDEDPTPTPTAPAGPNLVFKFVFDSTQARLNNFGLPATMPAGHAAQSPKFNTISAHYIELAPTAYTALGSGKILYKGAETTAGGANAIDFSQQVLASEGQVFKSFPLSSITPGNYEYLRVSLSYQNYDIKLKANGINLTGTIASFVGFNSYIQSYMIDTQTMAVNDDKLQGYWGFETNIPFVGPYTLTGQAPAGATTVPNPISSTSPIPAGSCVVTGPFSTPLTITGNETQDIVITISLSNNNSFEWQEVNADGIYEPTAGEAVVDMGIRGMIPIVN
jgi:hypothetical protein